MTSITSVLRRVELDSNYFKCDVEFGDNNNCIGDSLWFSEDGKKCEMSEHILEEVEMSVLSNIFDNDSIMKIINKFG